MGRGRAICIVGSDCIPSTVGLQPVVNLFAVPYLRYLAMDGVPIKEIQTPAGDKTIAVAARCAHLSPDAAAASERMIVHCTA